MRSGTGKEGKTKEEVEERWCVTSCLRERWCVAKMVW